MSEIANENVVKLDDYDQMRRGLGNGPGTHALREVRELAAERLKRHLAHMLGKVDDALFARAEKAESQMVQTGYLDAMRELGLMRGALVDQFLAVFNMRFNQGVPRGTGSGRTEGPGRAHRMSAGLRSDVSLEEERAIADMVAGARGLCTKALYALDRRLGFLIRDPDLKHWENPLGPEVVCNAFREAATLIRTDPGIRLVIFKLFDEHVVCHLNELYLEANRLLINLGVLPEGPADAYGRDFHARATDTAWADSGTEPQSQPADSPTQEPSGSATPGASATFPLSDDQRQTEALGAAALSALTLLQRGGTTAANAHGACFSLDPVALRSGNVNVLYGLKALPAIRDLGKAGDTTIDMVATLFDYILDDPNVPDAMRGRIGRLQVPVLKVALLDRGFFTRKSHPVRRLLNLLTKTSVGRTGLAPEDDPFYHKSDAIVQSVVDEFEADSGLFEVLLEDLKSFLRRENQRAQARAERSVRVQEGQERLLAAKAEVLDEIEPRIGHGDSLDFVRDFVASHWKNLLFITCARYGKDSEAWQQALATMDALIWSVKPKTTLEDRKRLLAMQPTLLADLRTGMEQLSIPATERDRFIARLVRAHGRAGMAAYAASREENDGKAARTQRTGRGSQKQAVADRPTHAQSGPAEDPHYSRARALKTGDWLQIAGPDEKPLRVKLSWISPITGTYLFTDHHGAKIGNYTVDELAELLREGQATVLGGAPLMERAVGRVLTEYPPE